MANNKDKDGGLDFELDKDFKSGDFSDVSGDQLEEFNKMLDKLSTTAESDTGGNINSLSDFPAAKDSIDDEIRKLLEQDAAADSEFEEKQSEANTLTEPEHIDIENEPSPDGEQILEAQDKPGKTTAPLKRNFLNEIPNIAYFITIGILGIATGASIFFLINANSKLKESEKIFKGGNTTVVSLSSGAANNSNFTYVSDHRTLNGTEIGITKFVVDSAATVFYFDSHLDWNIYNLTLTDIDGNIYNLDTGHVNRIAGSDARTVAFFEPLRDDVTVINLRLVHLPTSESVEFDYYFKDGAYKPQAAVLGPQNLEVGTGGFIRLEEAVFSSSGSSLTLSYGPIFENDIELLGSNYEITLSEGVKNLISTREKPEIYNFPDISICRLKFSPVLDFTRVVNLTINDLYLKTEQDLSFSPEDIYFDGSDPASQKRYNVGNNLVVLERIGKDKNKYILVAHAETKTSGRIELNIEAELSASLSSGEVIKIPGVCYSNKSGCDTVFDASGYSDKLSGIPLSDFKVNILSFAFKAEKTTFKLKLSEAKTGQSFERAFARTSIEDAFNSRLAYKSGQISKTEISGFSNNILDNDAVMENYTPEPAVENVAYSVEIIALSTYEDKFYAVVSEIWKAAEGSKEIQFTRNHKISGESGEDYWAIITDEII